MASAPANISNLINPGFEQPFAVGWTLGGDPAQLNDGSGDHVAVFDEFNPDGQPIATARSFVSQDILIGPSDNILTFDYTIAFSGSFTGGALRDAFSARILDPNTLRPLFFTDGRSDYFYHQVPDSDNAPLPDPVRFSPNVTRSELTGNPNRIEWFQVSADISSLHGQSVRLEFGLLRADNGQSTFAALDNVVPEPATALLLFGAILLLGRRRK